MHAQALTAWIAIVGLITAIVGLITGVLGSVLGILNYLRDNGTLKVDLAMKVLRSEHPGKVWGRVTAANMGRRPVFLEAVELMLDNGGMYAFLGDSRPTRMEEGGPSFSAYFDPLQIQERGRIVCAFARDNLGRRYYSPMSLRDHVLLRLGAFERPTKTSSPEH